MPVTLFLRPNIKDTKLAKCINVDKQDLQFITQIDQSRDKCVKLIESNVRNFDETLQQIDVFLQQQASYEKFAYILNQKEDIKEFNRVFSKAPIYVHDSIVNSKRSEFTRVILDKYFFNFYYLTSQIDSQLTQFDQEALKKALARLDYIRLISHDIIAGNDSGIELRIEFLDFLEYLLNSLILLAGALKAEQANASTFGEPRFNYKTLGGIYAYALQEAEKSQQISKRFDHDKKFSKDLLKFVVCVKNVAEIAMMNCMLLEYEVYQCNYREGSSQCEFIRSRMAVCVSEFYSIQYNNAEISQFFVRNFEHRLKEGVQNQQAAGNGTIARFPIVGEIKKAAQFVGFEPIWTDLKIK